MPNLDPIEYRDRRLSPRVSMALPAMLDFISSSSGRPERVSVSVTTLGTRGISILSSIPFARDQYIDIYLQVPEFQVPLRLSGAVRWSVASDEKKYFHGVRLDAIPPTSQTLYRSLMADQLLGQDRSNERRLSRELQTEVVRFLNKSGKRMVGLIDKRISKPDLLGAVIVPPGYGEIKTDSLMLAYYLAKNGFLALRYDATDHVGESDGEILNVRLTSMEKDISSAIDYLNLRFPKLSVGVVATSLSARAALRAAVNDKRIKFIVGIASVVNLQGTLKAVYKTDLVAGYESGKIRGTADILGFNVCDNFLADATSNDLHSLEGTHHDLSKLTIPAILFACERDPWVGLDEVKKVIDRNSKDSHQVIVIPSAFHNIYEDQASAKETLKRVVASALTGLQKHAFVGEISEPTIREIAVEARLERQRTRLLSRFDSSERVGFWEKYLTSFNLILKSADFQHLLVIIAEKLGDLSGKRILDSGCGNGNFGAWLMLAKESRHGKSKNKTISYVGMDYAGAALVEAEKRFQDIRKEQLARNSNEQGQMEWVLNVCDLNKSFPFIDSYFDKVCCNLVLSYVEDPLFTLLEIRRVLRVGGNVVVTSVKPMGNFSKVFNNFVRSTGKNTDLDEARQLISNAGNIRYKEKEGHFHFFSKEELLQLFQQAGFVQLDSCVAFEGDINVVSGAKS